MALKAHSDIWLICGALTELFWSSLLENVGWVFAYQRNWKHSGINMATYSKKGLWSFYIWGEVTRCEWLCSEYTQSSLFYYIMEPTWWWSDNLGSTKDCDAPYCNELFIWHWQFYCFIHSRRVWFIYSLQNEKQCCVVWELLCDWSEMRNGRGYSRIPTTFLPLDEASSKDEDMRVGNNVSERQSLNVVHGDHLLQ